MKEYKLTIKGHTKEGFDKYLKFLDNRYTVIEYHYAKNGCGTIFFTVFGEIFLSIEEVLE